MGPRANTAGDLAHRDSASDERIRDQRSVAAPRHSLRAHQGDAFVLREFDAAHETAFELGRLHIVGIPTKARVAPARVARVWLCVTQAAQSRHVCVMNPHAVKGRRESIAIELRIVSRAWQRAHIDDALHAVGLEEADEDLSRPRGVTDREDRRLCHGYVYDVPSPTASGDSPGHAIVRRTALSWRASRS